MSNAPIHVSAPVTPTTNTVVADVCQEEVVITAPVIDNIVHVNAPVALGARGQRGESGAAIQQELLDELINRIATIETNDNSNLCNLPPLP